jgi:hypothetical protein
VWCAVACAPRGLDGEERCTSGYLDRISGARGRESAVEAAGQGIEVLVRDLWVGDACQPWRCVISASRKVWVAAFFSRSTGLTGMVSGTEYVVRCICMWLDAGNSSTWSAKGVAPFLNLGRWP